MTLSATTMRKPVEDLETVMPFCVTEDGRREVTCDRLFCTFTWAMSSLVPDLKVSASEPVPFAIAVAVI